MGSHPSKPIDHLIEISTNREPDTMSPVDNLDDKPTDFEDKAPNRSFSNATTIVPPPSQPSSSATKPLSELHLLTAAVPGFGGFLNTRIGRNIAFHDYRNEPALYNTDVETHTGQTTISLRTGPLKKSGAIGNCYFDGARDEMPVSHQGGKSTLVRDNTSLYIWTFPAAEGTEGKTFKWVRQKMGLNKSTLVDPDWRLKDGETGEVYAVLAWRWEVGAERGQIQFRRSLGREWEEGVLIAVALIVEKERQRRAWKATRAAAIGGGALDGTV